MRYDDLLKDIIPAQDVLVMIFNETKKFLDNYAEKHPENIVLIAIHTWLSIITSMQLLVVIIGTGHEHEILVQADFLDKRKIAAAVDLLNEFKLIGSELHKKIINVGYMLHEGVYMTNPAGDRFSTRELEDEIRKYIKRLANDIVIKKTSLNIKDFVKTYGLPGLKDVGIV